MVSDVPYGIGFQHGGGGKGIHPGRKRHTYAIEGDAEPFDPRHLLAWPCLLFGGNHFYSRLPHGGTFHAWDKSCGVGPRDSFSDAEFAWSSWGGKSEVVRYLWKGLLQDGEKGAPKFHVMQKPIAVMEWAIRLAPADASPVIDPYMGSGSTGVACARLGRRFVGLEIDPGHFDTACRRIEEAYRQPRLFEDGPPAKPVQPSLLDGAHD